MKDTPRQSSSPADILVVEAVDQVFRTGFWLKKAHVLHGVSLAVPRGSIFGFLGANGAGKTTLIQLVVGLRRPTAGRIRVSGFDAWSREARTCVGYLPERPYFHEHLTGERLLHYFGALSGMSRTEVDARIPVVLDAVAMSHARKLELKKYSKGMLQRIGIAQAILHDPEFLILDEPMSGLDPVGRKEIRELILKLSGQGKTIFFSSHVIPDVESICDRVALIRKGRMIGAGPVTQFLEGEKSRTEIVFSGVTTQAATEWGVLSEIRAIPEGMRAVVDDPGEVDSVIRKILDSRGRLLELNPIRRSLEDRFEEAYR